MSGHALPRDDAMETAFDLAGFEVDSQPWGKVLRKLWDGPPDPVAIRDWAAEEFGANTVADADQFGAGLVDHDHDYSTPPPILTESTR